MVRRSTPSPRPVLLHREILPGMEPYLRRLRTPLACLGLAMAAATLCGLFLHAQGFVVAAVLAALLATGLAWPWASTRGIAGSIAFDRPRCREGEAVPLRILLRNRLPWAAWGLALREGDAAAMHPPLAALAVVPGWRSTEFRAEFRPASRGEYPRGTPSISCGFPFGLGGAARPLAARGSLVVWPRTFPVGPVPEDLVGRSAHGLAARDRAGDWGDPLGVRPYRRGDPMRRIHWGQTARHRELIVCEAQSNAVPRVRILVDTDDAVHAGDGPDGSREWAIRVAASFAEGWIARGAEVELILPGPGVAPPTGHPARRSAALLDALARLGGGPDGDDLATRLAQAGTAGLRLVVTTDLGLARLGRRDPRDRFVVLLASGFAGEAAAGPRPTPPLGCWIVIEGPARVAARLAQSGKEAVPGH